MACEVHLVNIFAARACGGNMVPIVPNAATMSDADMQSMAQRHGCECGFVLPAPARSGCDFVFRFWVPNHEMEMCGHATLGAVWLLHRLRMLPSNQLTVSTKSGPVKARVIGTFAFLPLHALPPTAKSYAHHVFVPKVALIAKLFSGSRALPCAASVSLKVCSLLARSQIRRPSGGDLTAKGPGRRSVLPASHC